MHAGPKVVFLGMCSGDDELIARWTASGDMPNLRRLMASGVVGRQDGLPGVYVGAHWPSWIAGCHPGKNRVHSWQQITPGSYDQYRCNAGDHAQRRPFWEALSDAGKRLCILDVPHSRVTPGINGLQTVEWGAHDAAYGFGASSPGLEQEILSRFGRHPVSGNSDADRDLPAQLAFCQDLLTGVRMKERLTCDFFRREPWDFAAQVFTEAHCAGHLLWHLHDRGYGWSGRADAAVPGDPLKDVYVAIDAALGAVLESLGEQTTVIFLANHGMGPKAHAQHLLDHMLVGLGYAAPKPRPEPRVTWRDRVDPLLTWGWQRVPAPVRDQLTPLRDAKRRIVNPGTLRPAVIEPASSRVFTIVNNSAHGALRVNLRGREPGGLVSPGAEYERLLEEVARDLRAVVNLETGEPVVERVLRCDDLYPGPERNHLPDLFVEWRHGTKVRAVGSDRLPRLEGDYEYVRSGEHRPRGMFVVRGPGIRPGRLPDPVTCMDWAPTICTLLGVRPDEGLDGRAIGPVLEALGTARTA